MPRWPRVWAALWIAGAALGLAALVMALLLAVDATSSARGLALSFASWFLFAGVALLTFAGGMRQVLPWGAWGLRVMLGLVAAISFGAAGDSPVGVTLGVVLVAWIGLSLRAGPQVKRRS